jgi:hypothetical protein
MDVHPTKNVSIGIDPYPYIIYIYVIVYVIYMVSKHPKSSLDFISRIWAKKMQETRLPAVFLCKKSGGFRCSQELNGMFDGIPRYPQQ